MLFYSGLLIVAVSLIIGFAGTGGNILIIFQPFELLIILGTAAGSFIISNPKNLLHNIVHHLPKVLRSNACDKEDYLELLVFLFNFFKFARSNVITDVENHIENPQRSPLFNKFARVSNNSEAMTFICDYMRMIVIGFDNTPELEQMMEEQLNQKRHECNEVYTAIQRLGDTFPALGILAAVLGVMNAMAAINASPDILGRKIAGALMGTFLGIFFSYAIVSPIGAYLGKYLSDEIKFLECIKSAIISYARGHPPTISVEFARQMVPPQYKPTFEELENSIKKNIIKVGAYAF